MRYDHKFQDRLNRLLHIEAFEPKILLTATAEVGQAEPEIADFSVLDVNPTSATFNQMIGPSDFRGQVSAWYFGFAT